VATLPIAKFHGVGPKTAAKMHAPGIETGADLRGQTLAFLQDRFGKAGNWYFEIARGQDDRPVQPDRERKSSGSETKPPAAIVSPRREGSPLAAQNRLGRLAGVIRFAEAFPAVPDATPVTGKARWARKEINNRRRI
jgi:nucleotidyltransferase/DNA polymerase involved in DNA repair